jgi:hypothetical protein
VEDVLERAGKILEKERLVFIIVAQRENTRECRAYGNVERSEAPAMLREAMKSLETENHDLMPI